MKKENEHEIFDEKYEPDFGPIRDYKPKDAIAVIPENGLQIHHVPLDEIDSLEDEYEAAPLEISAEYWTPFEGETRKVLFTKLALAPMPDINDKTKTIEKESVFMLWPRNGMATQIYNASARLVGIVKQFKLQPGAALQITYTGKMKNKTNSFSSDSWSVSPLIPKQK